MSLSRRKALHCLAGATSAALAAAVAGCGATATSQVIEKEVTVEVEKEVTSLVEVEKEVIVEKEVTTVVEVPVTPTVASDAVKVISYYAYVDATNMANFNTWVAPFQEAHPDILVSLIPALGSDIESKQKLLAMMVAGTPPDTLFFIPADFIWSGIVQPLDELIARDSYDISGISKPIVAGATYQNELYVLPMLAGGNNTMLCYNKSMYAEVGVDSMPAEWNDADWTWDEWVARMKLCARDVDGDGKIDNWGMARTGWLMSWSRMWNTSWINKEDMATITCDSDAMIDCYSHLAALRCTDGVLPPSGTDLGPVDAFMAGKTSMSIMGWWTFASYDACDIDWEFVSYPTAPGGNANCEMVPDTGGAIVKGSKYVDAAWEFIKWQDTDANFVTFRSAPPARAEYVETWGASTFVNHPDVNYMMLLQALENAGDQDSICYHPCWAEMNGKVVSVKWQSVEQCELPVEQMLTESKSEMQVIGDACQQKAF